MAGEKKLKAAFDDKAKKDGAANWARLFVNEMHRHNSNADDAIQLFQDVISNHNNERNGSYADYRKELETSYQHVRREFQKLQKEHPEQAAAIKVQAAEFDDAYKRIPKAAVEKNPPSPNTKHKAPKCT